MTTWLANGWSRLSTLGRLCSATKSGGVAAGVLALLSGAPAFAQGKEDVGGEASLKLPDLSSVSFLNGAIDGHRLLLIGIGVCVLGLIFGLVIYSRLKNLPVHKSMRDISELIYETCKTYLVDAGEIPAAAVAVYRRGDRALFWRFVAGAGQVRCGDAADYFGVQLGWYCGKLRRGVVWDSREHVCEFADGVCFAARKTVSDLSHAARSGHEHRDDADQRGTADDAADFAVYSRGLCGAVFHWICDRRILGAAALRIAGGIFTKIADIGPT